MAFAQELKRTVVMGALLAVAVGAIGAQAEAPAPSPGQSGAPESLLSSLVAPVVVSVVAFFASFAL
ncbi:unnamed protein product [Sphagnum jensenii]|uniref:Arabinogalactan-like protein n=1 Tax=Sphagnum jensenii TaxID=128206 RepID=A0ABP1A6U5_9BRYO